MNNLTKLICQMMAALLIVSASQAQNKSKVKKIDAPVPNGELCLGNTLVPKATFTNVAASAINIKAQLLISNVVTGIKVYGDTVDVMNVAAGADAVVTFDTFKTNPNILSQLGTFNIVAIGPAMNGSGVIIGDALASDDTLRSYLYGLRRTAQPFGEWSDNYSVAGGQAIPDQYKWVSVGATVVDGDTLTFDPPSPRYTTNGAGPLKYLAPMIKLDRKNLKGEMYTGTANGDTLTSYPVNLQGITKMSLSFDFHRSTKRTYGALYDSSVMYGLESTILNHNGSVNRKGDSLILEFKKPTASACQPSASDWTQIAAIDGGKDMEFQRFTMKIESKNTPSVNYFTQDFRWRLRLKAKADQPLYGNATDDEDTWYIDNVFLTNHRLPEHRLQWARVVSPYTKVPASQAVFPVYVKIASNSDHFYDADIIVQILGPDGQTKYYQRKNVRVKGHGDSVVRFPDWDARGTTISNGRECKVHAWLYPKELDYESDDNFATSSFFLNVESGASQTHEFAYDDAGILPQHEGGNDLPKLTGLKGQGVGFNNNTGSYAMKIKLMRPDTLYGIRVFFGAANASPDAIILGVYEGSDTSNVPGALVNIPGYSSTMNSDRRGAFFSTYWPYYFAKPIPLPGVSDTSDGVYWVSVSQLSLDNMAIGADLSRSGFDYSIKSQLNIAPYIHSSKYGTQYSATDNAGDISGAFAYEITQGTGNWTSLQPSAIFPEAGNPFAWQGRFAYIPMMRAMFGRRTLLPVEFAEQLKAKANNGSALLTWSTATEQNNHGFTIERQYDVGDWHRLDFVKSRVTNSSTKTSYAYSDQTASSGSYRYRLIQTDLDGTESVSNEAEVTILTDGSSVPYPNPFDLHTQLLTVPSASGGASILNVLGQTVRVLTSASGATTWDGKDESGQAVSPGIYYIATGRSTMPVVVK